MSFLRAVSGNQAKAVEANTTDPMAKTDRNGITKVQVIYQDMAGLHIRCTVVYAGHRIIMDLCGCQLSHNAMSGN